MITTEQLQRIYEEAKESLPQKQRDMICDEKSRKLNGGRMLHFRVALGIKDECTRNDAWEVRNMLKVNLVDKGHAVLPQRTRIMVENPPWKKALYAEAGQMMQALRHLGADGQRIKQEPKTRGMTLYYLGGAYGTEEAKSMRLIFLAEFHENKGWAIDAEGFKEVLPKVLCEQVLEKYRDCQH